MNNKQQTAVQWLVEQINSDCTNSTFVRPELIEKAVEMEKEQICHSYNIACVNVYQSHDYPSSDQYYFETYGKSKKEVSNIQ